MPAPIIAADPILERVTRAIADRIRPIRISLFGSRSRGDAREDSDYDLMVVIDDQAGADVEAAIHEAIRATGASVDVVVRTTSRFEEDRDDVGTLVYAVEQEGRTLYGAEPGPKRVRERRGPPRSLGAWTRRADNDFANLDLALTHPQPPWDTVCFHAHQCVEKLLKSVLIAGRVAPPRSHDLEELLALCPAELRDDSRLRVACHVLNEIWPKTRYPEADEPTAEEGAAVVASAREARVILMQALAR